MKTSVRDTRCICPHEHTRNVKSTCIRTRSLRLARYSRIFPRRVRPKCQFLAALRRCVMSAESAVPSCSRCAPCGVAGRCWHSQSCVSASTSFSLCRRGSVAERTTNGRYRAEAERAALPPHLLPAMDWHVQVVPERRYQSWTECLRGRSSLAQSALCPVRSLWLALVRPGQYAVRCGPDMALPRPVPASS